MTEAGTAERPARAGRQQQVRAQLIEVAAALLAAHGPEGVTNRAVALAAGVQPPAIYRLLGDKDGLLDAVVEHTFATYVGGKSVDRAADPLEEFRAGWQQHIDFSLAHPGVFALMADPRRATQSRAAALGRQVLLERIRRIAVAGRLRVGEQHAVDLTQAIGTGVVQVLLAAPEAERDLSLADTAYRGLLSAITTEASVLDEPGPVAAAAALRASADRLTSLTPAERALLSQWLDRIIDAGASGQC